MSTIEDRLREAFRADAQTVRPVAVRPFSRAGQRSQHSLRGRLRAKVTVPVAAAAAVAIIAVGTSVVLPRLVASHGSHARRPGLLGQGFPDGRMPSGPPPNYFVAVTNPPNTDGYDTVLSVINAATGQVTGRLSAPGPHRFFQAVAALGNDRTYVTAARGPGCDTRFYKFTLTAQGKPTGFAPLAIPAVPGQPHPGSTLAASSDGSVIAFNTYPCSGPRQLNGQLGVINLASRTVTTWSYRFPANPASLSFAAEARLLEMVNNPSGGSRVLTIEHNAAWIVRTNEPSGPLAMRYRKVFGPPAWPTAAVLSPTGRLTWALLPTRLKTVPRWQVTFAVYQTATGKLLRTWHIFPRQDYISDPSLSPDSSGRYLLVFQFNYGVELLDLATGRLAKIPGNHAYLPGDVAW
jgi:hypothetical protein